jgi:hypothetical protein
MNHMIIWLTLLVAIVVPVRNNRVAVHPSPSVADGRRGLLLSQKPMIKEQYD